MHSHPSLWEKEDWVRAYVSAYMYVSVFPHMKGGPRGSPS